MRVARRQHGLSGLSGQQQTKTIYSFLVKGVYPNSQRCYMLGNPVFSVSQPPPSISSNANSNESEGNFCPRIKLYYESQM